MAETVKACPFCGMERRVYKCEHGNERFDPVDMPAPVAERLRVLTEECVASMALGDTTVRLYRHAGLHLGGRGTAGEISVTRADARKLAEFIDRALAEKVRGRG